MAGVLKRVVPTKETTVAEDLEAALERFVDVPTPDYSGFEDWAAPRLAKSRERGRQALVSPGEDWSGLLLPSLCARRLVEIAHTLRARPEANDVETVKLFGKMKLLMHVLGDSDRGREFVQWLIAPRALPARDGLAEGLESCSPMELRGRLYHAVYNEFEREAFMLLAKLRTLPEAHDEGELDYLAALCHLKSNEPAKAIQYARRVAVGAADWGQARRVEIDAHACLGDVAGTLRLMKDFGRRSLTPAQEAGILQQLLRNAEDPDGASQQVEAYFGGSEGGEVVDGDPGQVALELDRARIALEFFVRLRDAREAQLSCGRDGADLDALVADVLSVDVRLRRLAAALSMLGLDEPLEWWRAGREHDYIVALAQRCNRSPASLRLVYEALFELGQHDLFMAYFRKLRDAIRRVGPHDRQTIGLLAYQIMIARGDGDAEDVRRDISESGEEAERRDVDPPAFRLLSQLSPMGKKSYEAAALTLRTFEHMDARWKDAGMISLGFFRIIEVEMNERIVRGIVKDVSVAAIKEIFLTLPEERKRSWERTLKALYAFSEEGKGPELGTLAVLLGRLARGDREADRPLRDLLMPPVLRRLTEEGRAALDAGEIEAIVGTANIERFRNPPAHARFVPLAVAAECKMFVDASLAKLLRWTRSDPAN
ncbi:MAG: hypothetical protein HY907_05940 [Deltaproteobacteria bacterium]|nr:hypothetical protein [Deltaproteobacteria bacterium]